MSVGAVRPLGGGHRADEPPADAAALASRTQVDRGSSASRPCLGSASMMPAAKPDDARRRAPRRSVLVVFGGALSTLVQSAVLSSTFIAARYASGIMPRYVVRHASTRTCRDRGGVGGNGGAEQQLGQARLLAASTPRTASATRSTVKPKCLNSTPAGADSPKVSMPTIAPRGSSSAPTYLCQKAVTPASTATRGTPAGSTDAR